MEDTTSYQDKGGAATEAITFDVLTGEEGLTSFDKNIRIRRVNTVTDAGSSGTALDLNVNTEHVDLVLSNTLFGLNQKESLEAEALL